MTDVYTSVPQIGRPGHCHAAQVFGPDGLSVATFAATEDPAIASIRAKLVVEALSGNQSDAMYRRAFADAERRVALKEWAAARTACIAAPINEPGYRPKLNRLADAEGGLLRVTRAMEEQP